MIESPDASSKPEHRGKPDFSSPKPRVVGGSKPSETTRSGKIGHSSGTGQRMGRPELIGTERSCITGNGWINVESLGEPAPAGAPRSPRASFQMAGQHRQAARNREGHPPCPLGTAHF